MRQRFKSGNTCSNNITHTLTESRMWLNKRSISRAPLLSRSFQTRQLYSVRFDTTSTAILGTTPLPCSIVILWWDTLRMMICDKWDVQTLWRHLDYIEEMKASEQTQVAKHCVNQNHADEEQLPCWVRLHTIYVVGLSSDLSVILLEKHNNNWDVNSKRYASNQQWYCNLNL